MLYTCYTQIISFASVFVHVDMYAYAVIGHLPLMSWIPYYSAVICSNLFIIIILKILDILSPLDKDFKTLTQEISKHYSYSFDPCEPKFMINKAVVGECKVMDILASDKN